MENSFRLTTDWMSENYDKYNAELFGGKLPAISFKISRARSHAGWASYQRDSSDKTVTPLAILMSNYYCVTEGVAVNVLLHEMIHIEDYTFNPEHFFDKDYDAHKSSFFQREMNRLNAIVNPLGYNVSVYVTREEHEIARKKGEEDAAKAYELELSKNRTSDGAGVSFLLGICMHESYGEVFRTEEKFMKKVYFGVLRKNATCIRPVMKSIRWYRCPKEEFLKSPMCKGALTNKVRIKFVWMDKLNEYEEENGLSFIGEWDTSNNNKLFPDEVSQLESRSDGISRRLASDKKYDINHNISITNTQDNIVSDIIRFEIGGRKKISVDIYCREADDDFSIRRDEDEIHIYPCYPKDACDRLRSVYEECWETKDDSVIEAAIDEFAEECVSSWMDQIHGSVLGTVSLKESLFGGIVGKLLSELKGVSRRPVASRLEDPSIVCVEPLSDGSEIVVQW